MKVPSAGIGLVFLVLLSLSTLPAGDDGQPGLSDEEILQRQGVGTSDADLIAYFKNRTFCEAEIERIPQLIQLLGNENYASRETASADLKRMGWLAHPGLKKSLETSSDSEVILRCRMILDEDEARTALTAANILVQRKIPGTAGLLLGYIPACSNDMIRDCITAAIFEQARLDGQLDEALVRGLSDSDPMRKSTSAVVLVRVAPEHHDLIRKLLMDPSLTVRNAVTRALVEAGDKQAIPFLIGLIKDLPDKEAWEVEDLLCLLAGQEAVQESLPNHINDLSRVNCLRAWESWWKSNESSFHFPSQLQNDQGRSERIICELTGGNENQGRIVSLAADNSILWQFGNVSGPMDVQPLRNGRLLVAEIGQHRVTERDRTGRILWEQKTSDAPMTAQKIRNGNVFIATHTELLEVTPDKKIVFSRKRPDQQIFCAQKLRNGNIIYVTAAGQLVEVNAEGKEIRTIPCGDTSNWGSVEFLQNGHFLVCRCGKHEVVEIDAEGKVHWRASVQWPTWAGLGYNGNILIACANSGQVMELNRLGKEKWKLSFQNRPSRYRIY